LNLYLKGPLLIRHYMWNCWKGLLMPWGASEESFGEITHWFFTTTSWHILRQVLQFLAGKGISAILSWLGSGWLLAVSKTWVCWKESISRMLRTLIHPWKKLCQTFLFRILKPILNTVRSGGNVVKSWREITLKNCRLIISAACIFRKLVLKLICLTSVWDTDCEISHSRKK
jgi:hypothetical protein